MKATDPAFPIFYDGTVKEGMTLLQYFMAHAPEVPEWFKGSSRRLTDEQIEYKAMSWPRYWAEEMIKRSQTE